MFNRLDNRADKSVCSRVISRFFFVACLIAQCFGNVGFAGSLELQPFAQGVISGTEPFNTSGKCHEPGDDCGSEDARVRTGDLMQFAWSITTENFSPGEDEFTAVIFEQTLSASANATVRFDRIPTVCLPFPAGPGGDNPQSSLTINTDGSQTLLCNLGPMEEGAQKSFSIPVRPSANSENASTFTSTQFSYALDAAGTKIVSNQTYVDSTVYEISAAPAFDLMADRKDMYQGARVVEDLGEGAGPEPGYMVYLNAHIAADGLRRGKGVEALDNMVTFNATINATNKDGVTEYDLPYKMMSCEPNPGRWPGTVYGNEQLASSEPLAAKVVDSGTCTFSGDDRDGYKFTLTGIDSQGIRYPTETATGNSLLTGPFFVAAYQIGFFVPFSAIEASDGDLGGNGGAVNLSTCLADFDPASNTGISNYASSVEPGYNGEAMSDGSASNNCTGPLTLQLSSGGGYNHRLVSTVDDSGNYALEPLVDIAHIGATSVEATTRYAHMETFSNSGSERLDDFQACFKFDNTVSKLIDASLVGASAGQYAFVAEDATANFDHSQFQVLYGSADFGTDSPIDRNADGVSDFDPTTGRYEGNWESMRSLRCVDGLVSNWVSDPKSLGLDKVNVVRFIGKNGPVPIDPGQSFRAFLPLEMREIFVGGKNDGQPIPVGTVAAAMSSFRTDQFYPEWRPIQYSPSPESSQGDGDRVTYTKVSLNAVLSTEFPAAAPGVTQSVLAGNDVVWKITPSIDSSLPSGGVAQQMRLTGILPAGSSFQADCTAQLPEGVAPTLIRYNQPEPGQQTLTWELGNRHSSDEIAPIVFCASTDPFGAEGSVRIASAFAQAANATASVPTKQSIALGQAGEIRAAVLVDVEVDGVNDNQEYVLKYVNFSDTVSIDKPTIINVLPFNGDEIGASRRVPGSVFSGSLTLMAEPTLSFIDGATPSAGEQPMGTIFYTADARAGISDNPNINTSFWCSYQNNQFAPVAGGLGNCPGSLSNVTAIKFESNYALARNGSPRQGQQITYVVSARANRPGNRYTNTFRLDSDDLSGTQTVRGRPASVLITSHSIGDLIFVDVNQDGKYSSQIDVLAPDGISVELRREADDSLVSSTATENGTFLFDLLGDGEYYVLIPAEEFGADKALRDWKVAPNAQSANTDANHDVDHSGISNGPASLNGVRTDTISLSSEAPESPVEAPTGQEPVGDNSFGLTDSNTNDDFSNLTIDIGLVSGDADKDGVPDIVEFGTNTLKGFVDSDNDGIPNYLDPDSDNDGINDGVEAQYSGTSALASSNSSQIGDSSVSTGDDTNGSISGTANEHRIADLYLLGLVDSDNDQRPDYIDLDSDNDAIPDALERGGVSSDNALDEDGDGVANYIDLDSDNDGVFDAVEADTFSQANQDSDRDGIIDRFDVTNTGGSDTNNDGIDDIAAIVDRDRDGNPDYTDSDSDNDGISDLVEFGSADLDADGVIDNFTDVDGNGVHDGLVLTEPPAKDTDADGIPDTHDKDTDGDGVPDSIEAALQRGGDMDGDGLPAQLDLDSDNDGITDGVEFGVMFKDTDGDDIDDLFDADTTGGFDTDADGIDDRFQTGNPFDLDGDGSVNASDFDSDNDGIADAAEFGFDQSSLDTGANNPLNPVAQFDANGDGLNDNMAAAYTGSNLNKPLTDSDGDALPDVYDVDSDDDGIPDALESATIDTDNDGLADYRDADADNDGIHDWLEARSLSMDADGDGISNIFDVDVTGGQDANNDGIDDRLTKTSLLDSDRDGIPDHLDLDSDGDGITDLIEAGAIDINGDGKVDGFRDNDNDGTHDGLGPIGLVPPDTDMDGANDGVDSDADNDGVPDFAETGSDGVSIIDSDDDGIADFRDSDSDNDGINDGVEAGLILGSGSDELPDQDNRDSATGAVLFTVPPYVLIDTDGDGLHNFRDPDSDNDGIGDADERGEELLPLDSDSDGKPDYIDTDADNDGIPDLFEGNGDSDNDGIVDRLDTDSDNDGLADSFELGLAGIDSDGDGIIDAYDADSEQSPDQNKDGISDSATVSGSADVDGDGIPDFRDMDSDGDGLTDSIEMGGVLSGVDTDGDGVADYLSLDADGDGVPDAIEARAENGSVTRPDSDEDGIPDYRDMDSDNDGIADNIESGFQDNQLVDSDNDGTPDMRDTDSDNDGISDAIENSGEVALVDTDADGTPDYLDEDSNDDGVSDKVQGTSDADGNGIPDRQQLSGSALSGSETNDSLAMLNITAEDSDGDGIPDSIESGLQGQAVSQAGSLDSDMDGTPDMFDLDSDNDGIADSVEAGSNTQLPVDSDSDGLPDYRDTDSDNDGIDDAIEGQLDFDTDGLRDSIDADSDNDGVPDVIERNSDSDGDGIINRHDADSDNDGVSDAVESGFAENSNTPANTAIGAINGEALDTDEDGIADFIDTDSDNDGLSDTLESGLNGNADAGDSVSSGDNAGSGNNAESGDTNISAGSTGRLTDTDGDGIPDLRDRDSDNDGTDDAAELNIDTDSDGVPDYQDRDANGNGIDDQVERSSDTDGDGIPDWRDVDNDNDGVPDGIDGYTDTDSDGLPNYIDTDSDGDGISDTIEAGDTPSQKKDSDSDGIEDRLDLDSDNDGVSDELEKAIDSDGDGVPDHIDTDSDNDGISDLVESGGIDADEDNRVDAFIDQDSNGISDRIDASQFEETDSDGDGLPDRIEPGRLATISSGSIDLTALIDSDNDGIPDVTEGTNDQDGDGLPNYLDADSDNDGLLDEIEAGFTLFTVVDSDADGHPDYLDGDSDNDGLSDVAETLGIVEDLNLDGVIDGFVDENRNGVDDSIDLLPVFPDDLDNDGFSDYLDLDTDADGLFDLVEANGIDSDNDGMVDGMRDSDADTIPDSVDVDQTNGADADADSIDDIADADFVDRGIDTDRDGIVDAKDIDPDGNGYAISGINDGAPSANWPDSNGDGIPDVKQHVSGTPVAAQAFSDEGIIRTGTDGEGSGCSVSSSKHAQPDPGFWFMLLAAIAGVFRTMIRRQSKC